MRQSAIFFSGLVLGAAVFVTWNTSMGTAEEAGSTAFFTDVSHQAYYNAPARSMALKGIVKGYDDGRFGPEDFVTRGQVVTMLDRYDQQVVQPLRFQIAKLRELLDLGRCGDRKLQVGEECDDGNALDGDGCSSTCLNEERPIPPKLCEGGYRVGESFPAPDGCNTCFCDEGGLIACTEKACLPPVDESVCKEKEQDLADVLRSSRACRTDDDCAVLVRGCSPYLTCGKPVNKGSLGDVKIAIANYIKECPEEGPQVCALCIEQTAVCEQGFCRLAHLLACTQDVKVCTDGSTVSRNPDLECEFDPCPKEQDCDPYICDDGTTHPRCSEGGHVINYLVDPCQGTN